MDIKMRKQKVYRKYIWLIGLISLAVSFLIHFPEFMSLFDGISHNELFPDLEPIDVFFESIYTFFSLLFLFAVNFLLFSFHHSIVKITTCKVLLSFVITWVLSSLSGKLFVTLHLYFDIPAIDATMHHYMHPARDFILSLLVTSTCYVIYTTRQKQKIILENEQLTAENIQNQYYALKNQLNPHMLFNSLNTLRSLVRENPDKAQDYIMELSRVLRYTLQDNEFKSVSLKEEMEFVEAYIFLMKMRYEENLKFEIDIEEESFNYCLPPLSLQMLIENAIKHNEISNRYPLEIKITTPDMYTLCVSNNIRLRRTSPAGMGIGLVNLSKRYYLLFKKDIRISNKDGIFEVCIPLVHP